MRKDKDIFDEKAITWSRDLKIIHRCMGGIGLFGVLAFLWPTGG